MTTVVDTRAMRWWDIASVMQLEDDLFAAEAWSDTMFWSELAERHTRWYVVVTSDDHVIAYAGLCAYPPHEAYVQTLAVARSQQGQGIGTRLLGDLVMETRRRGCRRLDLEVRADNPVAIGLYERHGFATVGRRRGYYQPSGTDALVMRKELS